MPHVHWNDRLSVGVAALDDDHKRLIELTDRLFEYHDSHISAGITGSVIDDLVNYTNTHFRREEAVLERHGFPGLDDHKTAHQNFINKINEIKELHLDGGQDRSAVEVAMLLAHWLSDHIMHDDKAYQEFLNQRGVV